MASAKRPRWQTRKGKRELKNEWWAEVEPRVSWHLTQMRLAGRLRRDPEGLKRRFLARLRKSEAVDDLIARGPECSERVERALAEIAVSFDDPALPELPSAWADEVSKPSEVPATSRKAEELQVAVDLFDAAPDLEPPPDQERLRVIAEALRAKAVEQSQRERGARLLDEAYEHREPKMGRPGYWWTPVAERIATHLEGMQSGYWDHVAALARDFFDATHTGAQIRSLVVDFRKRDKGGD